MHHPLSPSTQSTCLQALPEEAANKVIARVLQGGPVLGMGGLHCFSQSASEIHFPGSFAKGTLQATRILSGLLDFRWKPSVSTPASLQDQRSFLHVLQKIKVRRLTYSGRCQLLSHPYFFVSLVIPMHLSLHTSRSGHFRVLSLSECASDVDLLPNSAFYVTRETLCWTQHLASFLLL